MLGYKKVEDMLDSHTFTLYIGFIVWILGLKKCKDKKQNLNTHNTKRIEACVKVTLIGLVLWPSIWNYLVKDNCAECNPFNIVGFAWPILCLSFDLYNIKKFRQIPESRRQMIGMDANAICSLSFALSGILGARETRNSRMFLASVIGCLAFVMPGFTAPRDSIELAVVESVQRLCIVCTTGILMAASLSMISSKGHDVEIKN